MVTYFLKKKKDERIATLCKTRWKFYGSCNKCGVKNHMINVSIHFNFLYIGKINLYKVSYTPMFSLGFQIPPGY